MNDESELSPEEKKRLEEIERYWAEESIKADERAKQILPEAERKKQEYDEARVLLKKMKKDKKEYVHQIAVELCIWRGYSNLSRTWAKQIKVAMLDVVWNIYIKNVKDIDMIMANLASGIRLYKVDTAYQKFLNSMQNAKKEQKLCFYKLLSAKENEFNKKTKEILPTLLPPERINEQISKRFHKNIAYDLFLKSPFVQTQLKG